MNTEIVVARLYYTFSYKFHDDIYIYIKAPDFM